MSGFVCPNCLCESKIFPPISGGAEKMCLVILLNNIILFLNN